MVWYTRLSKLGAANVFKNLITTQNLSKQKHSFSNHIWGYKSPPLLIISSINNVLVYHNNLYKVQHNCNTYGGQEWRRSISFDAPTKACTFQQVPSWVDKCVAGYLGFTFVVVPVGVVLYRTCETIPYTYRTHFVFLRPSDDKILGEALSKEETKESGLLPEEHPDSVRVKSIGDQIVKALESDLESMKGKSWKKVTVDHLVGIKWEFLVVNDPAGIKGYSYPGGKIYVSTGLLKHLESDADIATIIGHEVGHIVARHQSRNLNKDFLVSLLPKIHLGLAILKMAEHIPHGVLELGRVLFTYPRRRREEREADYIGLLLMASAGFDPQGAPKLHLIYVETSSSSYFYQTHPSGKKRAEYLAKPKVMEEAKSIYYKTIESRKMNDIKDR